MYKMMYILVYFRYMDSFQDETKTSVGRSIFIVQKHDQACRYSWIHYFLKARMCGTGLPSSKSSSQICISWNYNKLKTLKFNFNMNQTTFYNEKILLLPILYRLSIPSIYNVSNTKTLYLQNKVSANQSTFT